MVKHTENIREGISLRNWFMVIGNSRCYGELMFECMGQPSQRESTVSLFYELVDGIDILLREDEEEMKNYVSEKKVTMIVGPKESVQAYLNGEVKRCLAPKIYRFAEIKTEILSKEAFAFSDNFQYVAVKKYIDVLVNILSKLIGYYNRLNKAVDDPVNNRPVKKETIWKEFERMRAVLNHLTSLQYACGNNEDITTEVLDYFQVSPFDEEDLFKLFEELLEDNTQPDITKLSYVMRGILSDKLAERYSVPVEKINRLIEENARAAANTVNENLSCTAASLLRDSFSDEDCTELNRFSSFLDLFHSGKEDEAETLYRKYLFIKDEDVMHDFSRDNSDYQYWRHLKKLAQNVSPENARTLKRVCYEVLGNRPSVTKAFPRESTVVRKGGANIGKNS